MDDQRMMPGEGATTIRPLDTSLFSFHEYEGDSLRGARQALCDARIRAGSPQITVVDGAIFVPSRSPVSRRRTGLRDGQPPLAGIVGGDGQSIATAHLHRGRRFTVGVAQPTAVAPAEEINEEVVYLGWLFDSYGHFLLESLARIWALDQIDPSLRVVFHYPTQARRPPQPWALRILAAFGVPPERILLPAVSTRFSRIIVPEPLFELHRPVHEQAAAPYQAVASRIVSASTPSPQPVYLSRRLLPSSQRQLIGEGELEDMLRENGFLVVHPETMTFEEQVRLFNAHTDIFSSTCSAAHNVLFARHRPRLHLLTTGASSYRSFFLCSALVGAPTAFVGCLETGVRSRGGYQRWLPEVVAPVNLIRYLDEIGRLKTRVRAALAGRDPALKQAYDEAWFYATIGAARGATPLSASVEREALEIARHSWPVSLALARHYARGNAARLDEMVRQLAELAAAEFDLNRLARYRADVEQLATIVGKRCEPATAKRLAQVLSDQFRSDVVGRDDGPC